MSVLQIIKDLIAEEDINFGDSDTTFNRQTHTGGTVAVSYVDSKSIPANTAGGYVDDYLHEQNTDTGTTATTFVINSGGNKLTLTTASLTGDRTYTFPDVTQNVVGSTDLASTASSKGASTVGVEDSAGYFTGTDVETVLAELAVDVAAVSTYRGYKRGFKLAYSSTSAVTIAGGMWDHMGTTTQSVYTNSQLTFTLGSGGSNSGSTNLGANELHYIYIDDSAVVTSGSALLTASEFINTTTVPSYSQSKAGWYNGSDRCIGCILTNGSSQIMDFLVHSDSFVQYGGTKPTEYATAAAPTSATNLDLASSVPIYSTKARLYLHCTGDWQNFAFNTTGDVFSAGICTSRATVCYLTVDVLLSTSQVVQWTATSNDSVTVYTAGYYQNEL